MFSFLFPIPFLVFISSSQFLFPVSVSSFCSQFLFPVSVSQFLFPSFCFPVSVPSFVSSFVSSFCSQFLFPVSVPSFCSQFPFHFRFLLFHKCLSAISRIVWCNTCSFSQASSTTAKLQCFVSTMQQHTVLLPLELQAMSAQLLSSCNSN